MHQGSAEASQHVHGGPLVTTLRAIIQTQLYPHLSILFYTEDVLILRGDLLKLRYKLCQLHL